MSKREKEGLFGQDVIIRSWRKGILIYSGAIFGAQRGANRRHPSRLDAVPLTDPLCQGPLSPLMVLEHIPWTF
ncbi:hypothetical protein CEXT_451081 [Caerostris extrusa]|uniref:Uncharacterized protein n=1 Tax=Caerostris extrusa TaxID=172846 RepID=A0AAV4Y2I8_CAEEX|nr:hypothetical protein CEXT_451081 [Caerostris extrusa]